MHGHIGHRFDARSLERPTGPFDVRNRRGDLRAAGEQSLQQRAVVEARQPLGRITDELLNRQRGLAGYGDERLPGGRAAIAGVDRQDASVLDFDLRLQDVLPADFLGVEQGVGRLGSPFGDAEQLRGQLFLLLGDEHVVVGDAHIGEHALLLSGEFSFRLGDLMGGRFAIEPQLAAADELLLDEHAMLLGQTAAAQLLPFVADGRIRLETDLDPVAASRAHERRGAGDGRVHREGHPLEVGQRQAVSHRWRRVGHRGIGFRVVRGGSRNRQTLQRRGAGRGMGLIADGSRLGSRSRRSADGLGGDPGRVEGDRLLSGGLLGAGALLVNRLLRGGHRRRLGRKRAILLPDDQRGTQSEGNRKPAERTTHRDPPALHCLDKVGSASGPKLGKASGLRRVGEVERPLAGMAQHSFSFFGLCRL